MARHAGPPAFEYTLAKKNEGAVRDDLEKLGYVRLAPPRDYDATMRSLRALLQAAIKVELGTIPPYMTALYTIRPEAPWQAAENLRSIVTEEMLHLVLAANVLNAIGGEPKVYSRDVMMRYPGKLPFGIDAATISLIHFSPEAVAQGLRIEQPAAPSARHIVKAAQAKDDETVENTLTIGEFYLLIESKLRAAVLAFGEARVFCGDRARQVTLTEYYYDGGGAIVTVTDLRSALKAMTKIRDQGEGFSETVWTVNKPKPDELVEVAHYYKFDELNRGRAYVLGDKPGHPSGEKIVAPYDAVYRTITDPTMASYADTPEIAEHARAFDRLYCELLRTVECAFAGEPNLLLAAVPTMMQLRDRAAQLVRNPMPGPQGHGLQAAPTFEYVPLP